VTPLVARLRNALLVSRRRPGVRGSGAPVKRRSDGYEFAELRSYVEGDDPRRIDWAATARAGGLQTRVVFEDHALTLGAALERAIVIGLRPPHEHRTRRVECAALWYEAALDEDRCARAGADGLTFVRGLRGRSAARLCSELREPAGSSFGAALHVALAVLPRDAQLLLVSDFFELAALEPLLRACTARFSTLALLASDPWRDGLPLGGFVRLRDAESGRVRRWYVGKRERERYLTAVEERERAVLARLLECGANAALLAGDGPAPALFDALGIGGRRSAAS
jgi:uncharacterized protein (DUF58 family)